MKKKSELKSAFLNPRVLFTLSVIAITGFIALVAFALYPGATAQAAAAQPIQTEQADDVAQNLPDQELNVAQGVVVTMRQVPLAELQMNDWSPYEVAPPYAAAQNAQISAVPLTVAPVDPTQATPTPTPSGSFVLLDTFTGQPTTTFTGSTPRTYMGDGFTNNTLPGGTTYTNVRSYTFYMVASIVANYTAMNARLALWNTYVQTTTGVPQFSNSAAFFDVPLGPVNVTAAPVFFSVNVEVLTPYPFMAGGSGTQWGYAQNFQTSTTGGAVADDTNVTSLITANAGGGGSYPAGQITTGTTPNFAYFRNASGLTNFNFLGTDSRTLGLVSQGVGIIIRGDPQSGPTPTPGPTGTPTATPTPGTPAPTPSPTATPTPPPAACNVPALGFEDFADVNTLVPGGWVMDNNSTTPQNTLWFQGSTAVFTSHAGAANAYVAANYQATSGVAGTETISNWLLTPPLTVQTGGQMSFWTRTVSAPAFPDRLQVRLSTNGTSSNVGTLPTDVGDFTTILADINPGLTVGGYPNVWTNFVVTIPTITTGTGRLAFRYFVTNGGPNGINSDYIGIDTVAYHCLGGFVTPTPSPTPTATPTPSPTSTPGPNGCQWTLSTVVPVPIMDNAVVTVGSNLYSFAGVSNNAVVANAYRFDGTTWTAIASVPAAVEFPAAATDGTDAYIVGGADGTTGDAVTTLYRYNVGANTYTTLAPCTTASWNHLLFYVSGKLYKIAGTDDVPNSLATVEIYDIGTNTWSAGAPMPTAASFPMGFVQGGFIYVGGGIDAATSAESAKTYRYNPATNTWDDAAMADLPATRWGGAGGFGNCCTNGGIFAGGYSVGAITFTALTWDLGSNTWSSLPNMNGERTRMRGSVLNGSFYAVGGRSNSVAAFIGTSDNQRLGCPAAPTANISGSSFLCAAAAPTPTPNFALSNVTLTLTGTAAGSTSTDGAGFYQFTGLTTGGNYTITPSKARRISGSPGINTVDVVGEQNHALSRVLLTGCRLAAGEAAGPAGINTVDVLAIQAFALGRTIPAQIGNVGIHVFSPTARAYTPLSSSQTSQNFDAIILGDVANPIASPPPRPGGPAPESVQPGPVASVTLPDVAVSRTMSNFTAAVTTSPVDASSNIVGFQGDFTFDERVISFASMPVQKAGLTAGNWVVDANVLSGDGPIRTLRISAYSTDMSPLSGSGVLFELKVAKVNTGAGSTQLIWDSSEDNAFFFVDADLHVTHPFNRVSGSVGPKR